MTDQKKKKESLERLVNSYEQAKVLGDTKQVKILEAIIKRIKENDQKKG